MHNRGEEPVFPEIEDLSPYATSIEMFRRNVANLYGAIAQYASGDDEVYAAIHLLSIACKRSFDCYIEQAFQSLPAHEAISEYLGLLRHDNNERCDLFNKIAPGSVDPIEKSELEHGVATIWLTSQIDAVKLSRMSLLYSKLLDIDIEVIMRNVHANKKLTALMTECGHSFCRSGTRSEYCTLKNTDDFTTAIVGFETIIGLGDLAQSGYHYEHDGETRTWSRSFDFLERDDMRHQGKLQPMTHCNIAHMYNTPTDTHTFELTLMFGVRRSPIAEDSSAHTVIYTIIQSQDTTQGFISEPPLSTEQFKTSYASDLKYRLMGTYDITQLYRALEEVEDHLLAEQSFAA